MARCLPSSLVISAHTASMGAVITMLWSSSRSANVVPFLLGSFDGVLEADEGGGPRLFELRDPPAVDPLDRHGVQVVEPAAPPGLHDDQVGLAEHGEVLHDHVAV